MHLPSGPHFGDKPSMARDIPLKPTDTLPLTCTLGGACCHGNSVRVNPWEIARLAAALACAPADVAARFLGDGATRLVFDGPPDRRGLGSCRLYTDGLGCSVHAARPLACRLFPLARRRRGDGPPGFFHRGPAFPCLSGCPEVVAGPKSTVADYLVGQATASAEAAQDAYVELVSQLGDGALVILIDSGLAATGDRLTLRGWRRLGAVTVAEREALLGPDWPAWRQRLMTPELPFDPDPAPFVAAHHALLQAEAQTRFGALADAAALREAATTMFGLALHLGEAVGADVAALVTRWVRTAREHGARD